MTDEKKDLSSLITLPPETSEAPEPAGEISPEPIQFEALGDLPEPTLEPAPGPALEPALESTFEAATQAATESALPPIATEETLDSIKSFSETIATSAQVGAAFPFTLMIEGHLSPEETEKLFSILSREKMGFREVDLEPQIAEGKILIPRISEYAGILIIQAMRGISAKIHFGPSDEIYSTPDTRDEITGLGGIPTNWTDQDERAETRASHEIPVSNSETLPQFTQLQVLDTVIASGLLTTKSVEAALSTEYEHLVEALIRELKFKAKRRGANGIVSLEITLTPLTLPTDYRVTVAGSAVKGN